MSVYLKMEMSGIHIDLITFIINIPEHHQNEVVNNIYQLENAKSKKPSANYKKGIQISIETDFKLGYLNDGKNLSYLSIEWEPTQQNIGFMRVSLYPTKINLKEVHKTLKVILFPLDETLAEILLKAKITELDLALDILGTPINNLLFIAKGMNFEEVITTKSKTIYLGNRKISDSWFCVYDKAYKVSQLFWDNKPTKKPITRIEFKRRGQKIPSLKDLIKSKNPFNGLTIYQYPITTNKDWMFNVLLASARLEGLKNTIGRITTIGDRKKYSTLFDRHRILNWNGAEHWPSLSKAIDSIINPG